MSRLESYTLRGRSKFESECLKKNPFNYEIMNFPKFLEETNFTD